MAKLCPKGKAAAKRKFKVYPSAYANMYASKVCKGKVRASARNGGFIAKGCGKIMKGRAKATRMTKGEKASAVKRKRAAGNPGGKPTNVATFAKKRKSMSFGGRV